MKKIVAITGASAGIGRATALRLARDGAAVAICARRAERLDAVASEIAAAGGTPLAIVADVTRESDMREFVARTVQQFGRLDVMMCNAGYGLYGAIDTVEADKMRRVLDVNYMGTYHAARAALPVFRQQRSGHVIVISSVVGKRGIPYMGPYAATKFAQVGLAECLRSELAPDGIHVSVVYPISTATEFFTVTSRESGYEAEALGPKQDAATVASAIVRAIERPVPEVFPHISVKALAVLNSIAPGFCDRIVRKYGRRRNPRTKH